MAEEAIKAGDTVQLKSGGPIMTVAVIQNSGTDARCDWFEKDQPKEKVFKVVQLKPHDTNRIGFA